MKKQIIGFALLLLALSGCGGGGSSDHSSTGGNQNDRVIVAVSPTTASVAPSGTRTFTATVTGSTNQTVTWSATAGSITDTGVFTAPEATGTYKVRATSQADPSQYAEATVKVEVPGDIHVTVSPNNSSIGLGQSKKFTASVTGTEDSSVTWEADGGTITQTGFYTAPHQEGVYTVTAHSNVDPSISGTATVTVSGAGITIFITPQTATLGTHEQADFDATVNNANDKSVSWTATGGSIDDQGVFTAPDDPGTYTIRATSNQDPTVSTSIQVTVNAINVEIQPSSVTLATGGTQQFSATVTGAKNTAVTWSASGGSITDTGFYTAPDTAGTYTVTATSVADNRRTATATVTVVNAFTVFYDFESGVPGAWVPTNVNETAPGNGAKFLGRLAQAESATLTTQNMTTHTKLRIEFDLYVIGDWEGENFTIAVGGTDAWTRSFSNVTGKTQSYPNGGSNDPGTGRTEADTLGYPIGVTTLFKDTTYHITVDVPHTTAGATIKWYANLSRVKSDQAWGLDNVRITALP